MALSDSARKLLAALQGNAGPRGYGDVRVTSGYRDPVRNMLAGGAKDSQHLHGNALDIAIGHLSDEQKAAMLEVAIANGARGIGLYPGGRTLHVDTRDDPAFWGPNPAGRYKGADLALAPAWAQSILQGLFNPQQQGQPMALADVMTTRDPSVNLPLDLRPPGQGAPLNIRPPRPAATNAPMSVAGAAAPALPAGPLDDMPLAALMTAAAAVGAAALGPDDGPVRSAMPRLIRRGPVAADYDFTVDTPDRIRARLGL